MDRRTAEIALQFLQRVQLQGSEVPAFVRVSDALAEIAAGRVTMAISEAPREAIREVAR